MVYLVLSGAFLGPPWSPGASLGHPWVYLDLLPLSGSAPHATTYLIANALALSHGDDLVPLSGSAPWATTYLIENAFALSCGDDLVRLVVPPRATTYLIAYDFALSRGDDLVHLSGRSPTCDDVLDWKRFRLVTW